MKPDGSTIAKERYQTLAWWRTLWTALIFAVGLAVTIFLIGAILLFIRQAWIPGAIATVASVVTGGIVQWLIARRKEAVEEADRAFRDATIAAAEHDTQSAAKKAAEGLFGR